MVKKLRKMAEQKASASGLLDSQLAQTVKDSAQQIWLAGLGAFAKAQEEGGKVFEALVKEGVTLQRKTQAAAGERLGDVTGKVSAMAEGVSSKAGAQWDKLESLFEDRVSKALNKLGVPTAKDVDALVQRIDALSAQVASLSKAPAARTPRAAKAAKTAAAPANSGIKPSAKRATARKTGAA
jgi:poly(hydroxyalkanoate) granule-associated protein